MLWEFKGNKDSQSKFSINWKGATFEYKGIIHVKAVHIERANPSVTISREDLTGEFAVQLGSVRIHVGADNVITATPDQIRVNFDAYGDMEFTFPFAFDPEMLMTISRPGQPDTTVNVRDYITNSEGKFDLQAKFNPNNLTGLSLPAIVNLRIALGQVGYPGYALIDSGWKTIKATEWKYE
jgi:hypothetical protein